MVNILKQIRIIIVLLSIVLVIFVCHFCTKATKHADWRQSKIVYTDYRDGKEDIYVVDLVSSSEQRLTFTEGKGRGCWVPRWSPDRRKIVFASNRDDGGKANIYVMDADGSNVQLLFPRGGHFDW